MKYKFLEHTADQYIRAFGKTLEEAFANGGLALFDTLTDLKTIEAKKHEFIVAEEDDLEALLYSYIEELLVKWEITGLLFSKIEVGIVERKQRKEGDCKFLLNAHIWGEQYNPEKHPTRVGVKAVTYCLMKIHNTPPKCIIEFVVDI